MWRPRARSIAVLVLAGALVGGCGRTESDSPGASLAPALATFEDGGFAFGCVLSQPMMPDTLEVLVGTAILHGATIDDYAKPRTGTAIHTTVAGRPAIFYDRGKVPNGAVGSDLDLEWQVARPGTVTATLVITARIRGPDVEGQRTAVQALVEACA